MGKCISTSRNNQKHLILPGLEEKYKRQIRKTKSLIDKEMRSRTKSKGGSRRGTQSFLNRKDFVGFNNNPLITEYRYARP